LSKEFPEKREAVIEEETVGRWLIGNKKVKKKNTKNQKMKQIQHPGQCLTRKAAKPLILLLSLLILSTNAAAQNVGINDDNSDPDASAMLDVKSNIKGFLPPRMTHQQLVGISSPAEGLMVFCTDCGDNSSGSVVVYNGGAWWLMTVYCLPPPAEKTHVAANTQIVWNWNAVTGASGYKWNTSDDYSTATDMFAATTKTETGLTGNTAYARYAWAYNACGVSTAATLTQSTSFPCGTSSITISHVASGGVAPVDKTVMYGTVNNIPGETLKCWITSNLGADHQATAKDDATEASAGWYWQFNLKQGYKHDGSTRTPNTTWINDISENSDWISSNDPCTLELGSGWRIPTYTEWSNVKTSGVWTNWNGPWNSGLKMHAAGYLDAYSGTLQYKGERGMYFSSSQHSSFDSWVVDFSSGNCMIYYAYSKEAGLPLRCLRDN
jgi:hypothetical protein